MDRFGRMSGRLRWYGHVKRRRDDDCVGRKALTMQLPVKRKRGSLKRKYLDMVHSYVYSKQPIFGLTQEWLRELSFSRLERGVHNKLHISSADWWDLLLPLA